MRQEASEAAHLGVVAEQEKWQELAERQERTGVTDTEIADKINMSREQVGRILSGQVPNTRSLGKIERAMDELEAEDGGGPLVPKQSSATRNVVFRLTGIYGVAEVVVEGPVENMAELEEAVEKILRRAQGMGDAE